MKAKSYAVHAPAQKQNIYFSFGARMGSLITTTEITAIVIIFALDDVTFFE